ncbi:LexA family protein [Acinetobacter larvae]|uniref:Peptidase S24 n=1 Tax=Acinetobacter larvae TaxID=1789224 RepID=A0A1B2LZ61_9GAMM|nr:S24 family peptidase [Acinetobacter larvae]AOA58189.1 peptidase S24 [Acinetobacter larvae]
MNTNTIGQRIRALRRSKKLTQAQLAKVAGVSSPAVTEWEKDGYQPKAASLEAMANLFGVTAEYILTGKEPPNKPAFDNNVNLSQKIGLEGRPIPVISWVAAGSFSPTETIISDAEVCEWLPPNKDCGKNGYGLIVTGISMSPKFEIDDRIYVNPDVQTFDLHSGDLVIVSCAGDTEATFKKLIIEGSNKYLQPLNPDWPDQIIKLTDDCRLVGKVVGLYRKI